MLGRSAPATRSGAPVAPSLTTRRVRWAMRRPLSRVVRTSTEKRSPGDISTAAGQSGTACESSETFHAQVARTEDGATLG